MARSHVAARWLSPLVGTGFAAAALLAAHGCGTITSGECTDKATCTLADAALDTASRLDGDASLSVDTARAGDGVAADVADGSITDAADASVCPGACAVTPTPGWSLIAFAPSRAPCPSGFTSTDLVDSPEGGACACGQCMTTVAPSCSGVTLPATVGQGCAMSGTSLASMGGQCVSFGGSNSANLAIAPVPATGGACAAPASADTASVTVSTDRICTPPQACLACGPEVTAPFTTCLAAPGEQSCPPGTTQKHAVGTAPALSCTACGCSMTASCGGTVTLYSGSSCTGMSLAVPVTGACTAGNGMPVGSYEYAAALVDASCTSGSSTPVLTLTGAMTVCCP
jgi:hypothetical protein